MTASVSSLFIIIIIIIIIIDARVALTWSIFRLLYNNAIMALPSNLFSGLNNPNSLSVHISPKLGGIPLVEGIEEYPFL